jgi:hypothetical protein
MFPAAGGFIGGNGYMRGSRSRSNDSDLNALLAEQYQSGAWRHYARE